MLNFKEYKEASRAIVGQLQQCLICNKPINPETDNFTLIYQEVKGEQTGIAVMCQDCCMLKITRPKELINEVKMENLDQ